MVNEKLDNKLQKSKRNPHNLIARVVIANHLIVSSIWFLLTLWTGSRQQLDKMQKKVTKFVWAGQNDTARHRVDEATICRPKLEGGLGLLSIPIQAAALSGRIMLWALQECHNEDMLGELMQHYIKEKSKEKWGLRDFTWMFARSSKTKPVGSNAFQALCYSWESAKQQILPREPDNREQWLDLPLWSFHVNQVQSRAIDCKSNPKQQLLAAGFAKMRDILQEDGTFREWENGPAQRVPASCRRAYSKLLSQVKLIPQLSAVRSQRVSVFMEEVEAGKVRRYMVKREEVQSTLSVQLSRIKPSQEFRLVHNSLVEQEALTTPQGGSAVIQILVADKFVAAQKKIVKMKIGSVTSVRKLSQHFMWADGKPIFDTTTRHMRSLMGRKGLIHRALIKWQMGSAWTANTGKLWRATWVPFRSAKENCFLWQIIYRTPATQKWRHPN
jgi:hypothetical protein